MLDILKNIFEKKDYSQLTEMERFIENGKKFKFSKLLTRPLYEFFKFYFLKLGFMDGVLGLVICIMNSNYKFMQMAKLYELEFKKKNPDLLI